MSDKDDYLQVRKQGFGAGLATGAAGVGALATLVATIVHAMPDDPLKPVLNPEAQVSPDRLAADIAKDPKLQERWKAMRAFVESLDQQVGKNLEQAAGASKDEAQHWKDRVTPTKTTVTPTKTTGCDQPATSEDHDSGTGFGMQRI